MPKILRIINRFNLGGPSHNVAYLSKYLSPEFETLLMGGNAEQDEESSEFLFEEMKINRLVIPEMAREINWRKDIRVYRKIVEIIQDFKPDIIHTHASKAGAIGRVAGFNCKVPVIIHTFHGHVFHSYFGGLKTEFYRKTEQLLARRTDAIIAISDRQKTELSEIYKIAAKDKIHVIPLGFDLTRFSENMAEKRISFRKKFNIRDDETVVMSIGRLTEIKNQELFISAISELKKNPGLVAKGVLVGDGERKEKLELAAIQQGLTVGNEKNEFKGDLIFTSWIKEVDYAIAGADLICLTSKNEGTPVSLIEAQAAGKPVVSTDVGGVRDVIYNSSESVVQLGDPIAFANKIKQIIDLIKKTPPLTEKLKNFAFEKFNYQRLTKETAQLYMTLLKGKM
mgnify:CR=1 FL=1